MSESFWHNQVLFRIKTSQTIRKLFRLSQNFPDYPKTSQTIQTLSRLFGNFSRLSRNFPDYPKIFQAIWKLSGPFVKYPDYWVRFRKCLLNKFRVLFDFQRENEIAQLKKCNVGKAPFLETVSSYTVLVYSACTVTIFV